MKHSFSLGIQKLPEDISTMSIPGCYWLMFDRSLDANLFCQQVIKAVPKNSSAALISAGQKPDKVLANITGVALKKIPLFSLPEKKSALVHLTTDMTRAMNTANTLYILSINSSIWHDFSEASLKKWLQEMSHWIKEKNSTLLILSYGAGAQTLRKNLCCQHRYLNGAGKFNWQLDRLEYKMIWWSTERSLSIRQSYAFFYDNQEIKIIEDDAKPINHDIHDDEFIYLAEKHVIEGKPVISEHWHLFDSNEELIKEAKHALSATLILAIFNSSEVETLARQIYKTRKQCGKEIKIIVRELFDGLRNSDVRLLLACGANLIVPNAVVLAKFITMLETVKGQIYTRHLPEDVTSLLESMHPIRQKGYLIADEFKDLIKARLENSIISENEKGLLIILEPKPGLKAMQALSICDLLRNGDIATVSNEYLVLFLSTCNLGDVEIALQFIFRMPIKEIFTDYQVYSQDLEILKQIKNLKNTDKEHAIFQKILVPQDEKPLKTKTTKKRILPTAISLTQKLTGKKGR